MNSNSLAIEQKQKQTKKIYNEDQAKKICSIRKKAFRYSYLTVRITTNDFSVPSFH